MISLLNRLNRQSLQVNFNGSRVAPLFGCNFHYPVYPQLFHMSKNPILDQYYKGSLGSPNQRGTVGPLPCGLPAASASGAVGASTRPGRGPLEIRVRDGPHRGRPPVSSRPVPPSRLAVALQLCRGSASPCSRQRCGFFDCLAQSA